MQRISVCLCVCVCVCVCVCICASNISADQGQTDLRLTTWLLRGSRVCDFAFVWTAMTTVINYFINALQIREHCLPEPPQSRVHQSQSMQSPPQPPTLRNKQSYTCSSVSWTGICGRSVLFCSLHLNWLLCIDETKRVRPESVLAWGDPERHIQQSGTGICGCSCVASC